MKKSTYIISTILLLMLSCNVYLYFEIANVTHKLSQREQEILHTSSSIRLTSRQEKVPDKITQRINKSVNRVAIGENLHKLNQQLNIQQLAFKISPEEIIPDSLYNLKKSSVTINMTNNSDQPFYYLINHILEEFPGIVMPKQIMLQRDLNNDSPLIKGYFIFELIKK